MSADEREFASLVESVCDARPVDWTRATSGATGSAEQSKIRALHEVARISDFNRGLQRAAIPSPSVATERWGDLLLLESIGVGANGEVFRAWDPRLQRDVALKLLQVHAAGAQHATDDSPLLDEARALARVRHPNVVAVHGIAQHDARVGVWMEFLRGPTLEQQIERRGKLDPAEVTRIGVELCHALAAVHAAGVVHRDVKPANVVCEGTPARIVLADFGLGQRRSMQDDEPLRITGTPMFMSPERLAGEPADTRSDVYAAGVTLWCALTGRHPFAARTLGDLRAAIRQGPAPALRTARPDVPEALVRVIEKAMSPSAADRFGSAAEMAAALEATAHAPADAERAGTGGSRRAWSLALVAALIVIPLVAWLLLQRTPARPTTSAAVPPTATPATPAEVAYDVEAAFVRRSGGGYAHLASGERVKPGDRLSLEFRATRPAWVYVLNEDERGESYLLFPQPRFDVTNPLPPDSSLVLPGTIGGRENAWTVTSRGGREHFLVVASPQPVTELEAELQRIPVARPGREVQSAPVAPAVVERLRGVGGVTELPATRPAPAARVFEHFRTLAGREQSVRGVWVREVVLENPLR